MIEIIQSDDTWDDCHKLVLKRDGKVIAEYEAWLSDYQFEFAKRVLEFGISAVDDHCK